MSWFDNNAEDLHKRIKRILAHRKIKRVSTEHDLVRAAVLLPLLIKDDSYHILFTKRTNRVSHHKGEVSFPGGIYDDHDVDLGATALRETHEEIGVRSQDVKLLGGLDEVVTVTSHFIVSPFVGLIPYPYPFNPCREEIEEILLIPLQYFSEEGVLSKDYMRNQSKTRMVYIYQWGHHSIWGATAEILHQFLELICGGGSK